VPIVFHAEKQGDQARIVVKGDVTDDTDLAPMIAGLKGKAVVDLGELLRMNSVGVRQWVRFVHGIPADLKVSLERCPVFFLKQVTMIGNFLGPVHVASAHLPYVCTKCDATRNELHVAADLDAQAPPAPATCTACSGAMELDESEDVYAAFVKEIRRS
jgi:hypothetical protein